MDQRARSFARLSGLEFEGERRSTRAEEQWSYDTEAETERPFDRRTATDDRSRGTRTARLAFYHDMDVRDQEGVGPFHTYRTATLEAPQTGALSHYFYDNDDEGLRFNSLRRARWEVGSPQRDADGWTSDIAHGRSGGLQTASVPAVDGGYALRSAPLLAERSTGLDNLYTDRDRIEAATHVRVGAGLDTTGADFPLGEGFVNRTLHATTSTPTALESRSLSRERDAGGVQGPGSTVSLAMGHTAEYVTSPYKPILVLFPCND